MEITSGTLAYCCAAAMYCSILQLHAAASGITKLQRGDEKQLNKHEKEALAVFKNDVSESVSAESGEVNSYIDKVISRQPKVQKTSYYRPINHVSPMSCICERVFSKGQLILTDLRGSMDPSTFEDLLILSYNHDLWDVYLVNGV